MIYVNKIILFLLLSNSLILVNSTRIKGTFKTNEFFKFLLKFGFQKTDRHQKDTHGYIFGNITSKIQMPVPITFAVLDRTHFLEYYENRSLFNKEQACKLMFNRLKNNSFDAKCNVDGKDFLRKVPCPKNKLCIDEDSKWNVVKGYQFTYVIQDFRQPK